MECDFNPEDLLSTHPPQVSFFHLIHHSCLIALTVSIFEDDSQHVSPQQLVVVNNPEWLHLRVHVPTLPHADERMREAVRE